LIISHKHRFIFIKTVKTAGTSIEVFLSGVCGEDDVVTPIKPHVDPHRPRNHEGYYNHMPGHVVRERIGRQVWDSYFKFCVERNPWDKAISHYFWKRARANLDMTFDQYVWSEEARIPARIDLYTEPQDPGTPIVDEILRYEDLNGGLARVFDRLGIPFAGRLDVQAKGEYRTDRRDYREVYTPEQARKIAELYAREIQLLDYRY
jgi:hypothetical protein